MCTKIKRSICPPYVHMRRAKQANSAQNWTSAEVPCRQAFLGVIAQSGEISAAYGVDMPITFNHGVEGSSPSALTNEIRGFHASASPRFPRWGHKGGTKPLPAFDFH
jgi:hypothetical protein